MEQELNGLMVVENTNMCTPQISKRIKKIQEDLKKEKSRLKRLEDSVIRQKNFRDKRRAQVEEVCEKIPTASQILKVRKDPGRPRIENDQPDLLKIIVSLVTLGSGAHLRRRDETIRSCRTLDELTVQLQQYGYNISRSGAYLRLLPRFSNSHEGLRHVKTVPVKLVKAQTSEHKFHDDTTFCTASIMALNSLASFLGKHF